MQRAVIYARCSTEEESQKDALAKQVAEARECVQKQGWILVDSYVESRSGTSTKGRLEYNRLYEDLTGDRFDIIVIKSQDRLMRNTKDWYLFVDRLITSQKQLFIYIEQKFYSADDALITGIKAILAEEYSRELSKKINNAHHNRQKNGGTVILTSHAYGYRKLPDKSVEIIEEEAKIKRRMYELCAAGYGSRRIASILQEDGVCKRNGKPFSDSDIRRIIQNPLNKGTVVMNRTHYDFDSKKTMKNPPKEQFIYENRVPATVCEELWERANLEIRKRAGQRRKTEVPYWGKNPGKSLLSGKLYCGLCKEPYYRTARRNYGDGKKIYEWKCKHYLEQGKAAKKIGEVSEQTELHNTGKGCNNVHLKETALFDLLGRLVEPWKEKMSENSEEQDSRNLENTDIHGYLAIMDNLLQLLRIVLKDSNYQPELEREEKKQGQLIRQMSILVDKLLLGVISDEIYCKKQEELEEKLTAVKIQMGRLKKQEKNEKGIEDRIIRIKTFLENEGGMQRAVVEELLEKAGRIEIFPQHMEIFYGADQGAGEEKTDISVKESDHMLRIDYGSLFDYHRKKREEREKIVEQMQKNPSITAKQLAAELGIGLSGVNYRINILKKEGRIRYQRKGKTGEWEVL